MHTPDVLLPSPCGAGAVRQTVVGSNASESPRAVGANGLFLVNYQCAGASQTHLPTRSHMPAVK
jgi:hypothetical protein